MNPIFIVLLVLLGSVRAAAGDTSTTLSSDEYYDDEDYVNQAQSGVDGGVVGESGVNSASTTPSPYQCPLQCRCWFNKPAASNTVILGGGGSDTNDYYEEDDDTDETKRSRRRALFKRDGGRNTSDYDDEEDDETSSDKHNTGQHSNNKYDITVDCTGQGLSSISNLFDYDFPLEQIVSLNLSYNSFRVLRLDDGFEDLISLQELDLSANHQLRSLSPRNFLRKFRHLKKIYLNNINQINCQSMNEQMDKTSASTSTINRGGAPAADWSILSKSMPIDCRWYKSLLYLYRRNTTIVIEQPAKCNLDQYLSTNTISLLLMSKCFSSELLLVEPNDNKDTISSKHKETTNSRIVEIDANNKYEFNMEPSVNQVLVEGDSLELTCRLKKLNTNQNLNTNFQRLKMNLFYKSQIVWYVNESQLLHGKQVQLVENKAKLKNSDFLIESKLILAKTSHVAHSGRFYCGANLYVDNARHSNRINTSSVEIKIVDKFELDKTESPRLTTTTTTTRAPLTCPEMIIQTYKGVYKWPKTVANSRHSQSCTHSLPYSSTSNSSYHVSLDCLPSGEWSHRVSADLQCQFESNLTKYLDMLNSNLIHSRSSSSSSAARLVSLEDFIHDVVKIQTTNQTEMNMYDIVFIQNYLNQVKLQLQRISGGSNIGESWRYQLLLVNDMFAKLNSYYFDQARRIAPKTFSRYFVNTLLDTIQLSSSNTTTSNGLSTSLAFVEMTTNRTECSLGKYQLTQQLYFQCNLIATNTTTAATRNTSRVKLIESGNGSKVQVILFDTDKLFPYVNTSSSSLNYSNYDKYDVMSMEQLADLYINEMDNTIHKNRPCGQIYAIRTSQLARLDLTLQLKLPLRLVQTVELVHELAGKNVSENNNNNTLFDQVFGASDVKSQRLRSLRGQLVKFNQTEESLVVVNSNLLLGGGDESYYLGLVQHATRPIQEYVLASPRHFEQFRQLVNKWLSHNMYEVVYGRLNNLTIEWSHQIDSDIQCELISLDKTAPSLLTVFATLRCRVVNNASATPPLFVSVRHKSIGQPSDLDTIQRMIEKYGKANNLITSRMDWSSFKANYTVFRYKIIYFFTLLGLVLLLTQSIVYMCCRARLLMPRSMFHSLVNKWLCLCATISVYLLGIQQTRLPLLCFLTSLLSLFFLLATFIWYLLTFYSFFVKLNRLKKRNFQLIFHDKPGNKKIEEDVNEDEDVYTPKPVIYLYMLGYGVPFLFCALVVSIVKREFVQAPYSYCFTNNVYVLAGALLAPVLATLLVIVVLIVLVIVVLRRIIHDLKYDKDDDEDDEEKKSGQTSDEEKKQLEDDESAINTDDKIGMWRGEVNYYDMKNENEQLNVKQNRIVNSPPTKRADNEEEENEKHETSTTSSTSTFFDKRRRRHRISSSVQSDQTSIMDAQHTPGVQLKYSVFSLLLFILICVQASLLMTFNTSSDTTQAQLVAYSLAILVFVLCVSEISFYLLSREDLMLCREGATCLIVFSNKKKYEEDEENNNTETNSPSSSYRNYAVDQNNLYFEPKALLAADHQAAEENNDEEEEDAQQKESSHILPSIDKKKRTSGEEKEEDNNSKKSTIEQTHTAESTSTDAILNSSSNSASSSSSSSAFSSSDKKDTPIQKVSLAAQEDTGSGSEYQYHYNYVYHHKPPPAPTTISSSSTTSGIALRKQTSSSTNISRSNQQTAIMRPSTNSEQTTLITNDSSSCSLNTSHNSGKQKSLASNNNKKPQVNSNNNSYSDYNHYEEDNTIYQRLVTTNSALNTNRITSSKAKLNELLNQKCASHTGTAIELSRRPFVPLPPPDVMPRLHIVRDMLKSGSGTSSSSHAAVDSVISSSDSVSSMNSKDLMPPPPPPPITSDRSAVATKSSSQSSSNLWQTSSSSSSSSSATSSSTEYVYTRLPGINPSPKVQTLIDSKLTSSNNNNTLSSRNSIFKPKEVEAKHETSV